ncbi:MAG: hypothetical protein J2P48_20175, partial [Alphaproteobacteria bacterium]|nr:hypothetical protein [Alphaproteobacteria bacterium]
FCIGSRNAISKITGSAAGIFRALGDPECAAAHGQRGVRIGVGHEGERLARVSGRLKALSVVRWVRRRHEAKHAFHALSREQ